MENKSLTWMEIRDKLGKPIWDNKQRQWRVVDGYKEDLDNKRVSFTDYNAFIVFDEGRFYLEEVEEKEEK